MLEPRRASLQERRHRRGVSTATSALIDEGSGLVDLGMTERPVLESPPQHQLGWALVVGGGDSGDDGVVEGGAMPAVAVEADAADP